MAQLPIEFICAPPKVQKIAARIVSQGKTVVYDKPEGFMGNPPCVSCGCNDFFYMIGEDGKYCVPYCLECGKSQPMPARSERPKNHRCVNRTKNFIREVKAKYGNKCAFCETQEELEVHHIIPFSIDETLRYEINNGILLCKKHHKMAHLAFSVCHR